MRPEIKRMQAQERRKQLIVVGLAAVATVLAFFVIEVFSG
jgi:hypothetical protein